MGDDEMPTQETPAGHKIPVPKRTDVLRDMRKVAGKAPKPESDASSSGAQEQQGE